MSGYLPIEARAFQQKAEFKGLTLTPRLIEIYTTGNSRTWMFIILYFCFVWAGCYFCTYFILPAMVILSHCFLHTTGCVWWLLANQINVFGISSKTGKSRCLVLVNINPYVLVNLTTFTRTEGITIYVHFTCLEIWAIFLIRSRNGFPVFPISSLSGWWTLLFKSL